jgi:hypothetical protein
VATKTPLAELRKQQAAAAEALVKSAALQERFAEAAK